MSVKIVGKLKSPNGWAVVRNKKTGHIIAGWDDVVYHTGNIKSLPPVIERAKANMLKTPVKPLPLECPSRPETPEPDNRMCAVPASKREGVWPKDWLEYDQKLMRFYDRKREISKWEEDQERADLELMDFYPVFQAELLFTGYSRGRSSVTMNFKTRDGQKFSLGPSCIDSFISHIANRNIVPVDEGYFPVQFRLIKQGANVYMEPYYDKFEAI